MRYLEKGNLVHIQVHQWPTPPRGLWMWPMGHVEATMRQAQVCAPKPVTCVWCLLHLSKYPEPHG